MGFDLSTMLGIMWNHPLLCGSVLLLLTPSLFHIVLYFSPLLISTALFIVALVSMGPRMEETQQERETWAKGEKPLEGDNSTNNWPYTDWGAPDLEPLINPHKRSRAADDHGSSSSSWLELLEEGKSKFSNWIENMYKASEQKQPLVPELTPPKPNEKQKPVSDQASPPASSTTEAPVQLRNPEAPTPVRPVPDIEEVVEEVKTLEVEFVPPAPAPQASRGAPSPPVDHSKVLEKELDMPELETVEVPQAELAASEMVAAEVLAEKNSAPDAGDDQPIWDDPVDQQECVDKVEDLRAPLTDDDLMDVPLNDPVQEPVHDKQQLDHLLRRPSGKESSKQKSPGSPSSPSPSSKHVRFLSESSAGSPPPLVSDVILKNLQNHLDELQAKKRSKYTEILSRRMSIKNGTRRH